MYNIYFSLIPSGAFSEDGKKHSTSSSTRLRKIQSIERTKHEGNFLILQIEFDFIEYET